MERAEWLNLNGRWEFEIDSDLTGEARDLPAGRPLNESIIVPFCPESKLSGIGNRDFMPCVWYKRAFTALDEWQGKRVLLHFGAVDYDTTVWVNGRQAGFHRGGYSPFTFDITDLLVPRENVLVVRAVDDTRSPLQPTGKQSQTPESEGCCYTRTTGIWQTVWLEPVPAAYIRSFRLYPDLDQGSLTVQAVVEGAASGTVLEARALACAKEIGRAVASAASSAAFTIRLPQVHPWTLEDPFLYDLEITLQNDGRTIDKVGSYFGLRRVHIEGKKILINNKPVFQRLVLDQGFYPDGIYTAPNDDALRRDIELSKAVGFNGARLHQKVFEPRFLYWADRRGYLVWGEFPDWGVDHAHPSALERILPEWIATVERDFNHPSIVGWCPFNETPESQNPELLRTVYRVTKALDPTRPVIDTSGYVHVETDVYDSHNYTADPAKFLRTFKGFKTGEQPWHNSEKDASYRGQPYFVSEYGGIWWNPGQADDKAWGYGKRPKNEQEFLDRYRKLTEALLFHPRMFGFCYTQLYDIEQEVNGLYTYDRRPKFDPETIRKINSQRAAIEKP